MPAPAIEVATPSLAPFGHSGRSTIKGVSRLGHTNACASPSRTAYQKSRMTASQARHRVAVIACFDGCDARSKAPLPPLVKAYFEARASAVRQALLRLSCRPHFRCQPDGRDSATPDNMRRASCMATPCSSHASAFGAWSCARTGPNGAARQRLAGSQGSASPLCRGISMTLIPCPPAR